MLNLPVSKKCKNSNLQNKMKANEKYMADLSNKRKNKI